MGRFAGAILVLAALAGAAYMAVVLSTSMPGGW
jgi:hypothetical protein